MRAAGARAMRVAALTVATLGALGTGVARGAATTVDRVAARYFAPETGGAARPRFVTERVLAFESRLEALAEGAPASAAYDDCFRRAAFDRHVAEDLLAALEAQSGADPLDLASRTDEQRRALVERVGGAASLKSAMTDESIEETELEELLRRRARAADYVDKAITPILHPTEEQLREVQRTSQNPFKQAPFEQARGELTRWFIDERLRAAETTFLQSARARVHVVVTSHERT